MFLRGRVSYAQVQGTRKFQEDYMVHVPFVNTRGERGHLIGVMDGNSPVPEIDGGAVAKYCAKVIRMLFDHNALNTERELLDLTAKLDECTSHYSMGSTLSLAHINESRKVVTTALLGDSPIIVVDKYGRVIRSNEHNVRTNLHELAMATERGAGYYDGCIYNDPYGKSIRMSRALGCSELRNILNQTPTICTYAIDSRSMVIIASDGFLDSGDDNQRDDVLLPILAAAEVHSTAAELLRWREEEDLFKDNASVIIWKAKGWWDWRK